jgi:hypothetical protein
MLYTGYFAKAKQYVDAHLRLISIANRTIPNTLAVVDFKPLAPGDWIYVWKQDLHNRSDFGKAKLEYLRRYYKTLHKYGPRNLFKELNEFTNSEDAVLLCYEAPPEQMGPDGIVDLSWLEAGKSFCHRHIVSDFLRSGGYDCKEYVVKKPEENLFDGL